MAIPHAPVLTQVLNEAADIAQATSQTLGTGHLLLAFFTVHNAAERLLREREIDEDRLLDVVDGKLTEHPDALGKVMAKAEQVAGSCGASEADCLHVLYGMTRERTACAFDLLKKTGESVSALRQKAMGIINQSMPVWVAKEEEVARSHVSHHGRKNRTSRRTSRSDLPRPGMSAALKWAPPLIEPQRKRRGPAPSELEQLRREKVDRTVEPMPVQSTPVVEAKPPASPADKAADLDELAAHWALDPDTFPWLTSLGRNLSVEAAKERLDTLVGRASEIDALIDILGKRRTNNPCLLGEPGVGKTAVVEGLALRLVDDPPTPTLGDKIIVELDVGSLLIGTHLRGSFSEKLQGIKEEVKQSGRVIVFFDELHTLVGAGAAGDGAQDAANELKSALARGEFPCIGATTTDEWKKHIESDPALQRRFYPVLVKEPSVEEAIEMLTQIVGDYGNHHRVSYEATAVAAAVELSARYIVDRHLPDKAIALIDLAGSRAARAGEARVTRTHIARLIAKQAEIPVERVLSSDRERLLGLEKHLSRELVGHTEQLQTVADVIRRNAAGFGSRRPQGSFLFLGPTGVGKTETAKVLAKLLHGSEDSLLRFDLSEFCESQSVARLVGAPPGYIGHDAPGQLTDAVRRRPARVILLDEIEKAHREVLQLFLQVLDDGRLSDTHGRTVSFAETIIIMTSNLGADLGRRSRPIGFGGEGGEDGDRAAIRARILEAATQLLAPELWARIEEKLVFAPLTADEVREVTRRLVATSSERLEKERGIQYALDDSAVDYLVSQGGYDSRLGARPMRQILSRIVEARIAARILEGRLHADEQVLVSTTDRGTLAFLVGEDRTSLSQRPAQV